MLQAFGCKESGNDAYNKNETETAIIKYRTGLKILDEHPYDPTIYQVISFRQYTYAKFSAQIHSP